MNLKPYNLLFKPRNLILASLKSIPKWAKQLLEKQGFYVVDEFYPKGKGVKEFMKLLRNILFLS